MIFKLLLSHCHNTCFLAFPRLLGSVLDCNGFVISDPNWFFFLIRRLRIDRLKWHSQFPIPIGTAWQVLSRCDLSYLPRQNFSQFECLSMDYRIQSFVQLMQKKKETYNVLIFFQLCVIFCSYFKVALSQPEKKRGNFIISPPRPDVFWIILFFQNFKILNLF